MSLEFWYRLGEGRGLKSPFGNSAPKFFLLDLAVGRKSLPEEGIEVRFPKLVTIVLTAGSPSPLLKGD